MEPKKVKKLAINQEIISNLNDKKMSGIIGGSDYFCSNTGCDSCPGWPCTILPETYIGCPDPCEGCPDFFRCPDRTKPFTAFCGLYVGNCMRK